MCRTIVLLFILFCHAEIELAGQNGERGTRSFADSLYAEINGSRTDTASLNRLYFTLRNNRVELGEDYKPLLNQYIEQTRKAGHLPGLMLALDRMGLQERFDENYQKALELHEESLTLALQLADSVHLTFVYSNIGQVYRKQDLNIPALTNFHLALAIQEAINDTRGAYFTQNVLGATYFAQQDYEKAFSFLQQSLKASLAHNDARTTSYNYGCLGEIYLAWNKPDSALYYFEEGRKLKLQMDYDKGLAVSDHLIGQAWYSLGEVLKAKVAFLSALERHRKYGTERYQSLCLAYLGKIAQLERQYAMAEQLLLEARGKAQKVNSLENLVIIEEGLFELYRNTGRVEEAFDAMMLQYAYRDSINSAKNKQSIQQLEVVYETRQKEHQIELLSKESMLKTQRMRLGGGIIFLMILIIVLISVLYSLKQRNALVIEAGLQHRLSRSQMNPHFVSNAMSSIQKYVMENDPGNAMMYLGKFSILNRAVLEHSMLETIPLSEEIDILRRYLEFEQLRLGNSFSYTFDIKENLDAEMIYIPPLFIQPFVENAVKHGVKDMKGEGMIRIRFSDMGKVLKVEIIDNGVGMDVAGEVESLHQSRSMEIIKKRLHLLRRKYKKLPDMEIKSGFSGPGGVHVVIYLPII